MASLGDRCSAAETGPFQLSGTCVLGPRLDEDSTTDRRAKEILQRSVSPLLKAGDFAKAMGQKVTPGKAALCLLIGEATTDRVMAEMKAQHFGGELIQSNLSEEDEAKLRAAAAA